MNNETSVTIENKKSFANGRSINLLLRTACMFVRKNLSNASLVTPTIQRSLSFLVDKLVAERSFLLVPIHPAAILHSNNPSVREFHQTPSSYSTFPPFLIFDYSNLEWLLNVKIQHGRPYSLNTGCGCDDWFFEFGYFSSTRIEEHFHYRLYSLG